MKTDFICPKCGGHLSVGGSVILSAINDKGEAGIVLLSPHLGDYSKILHPSFKINDGSKIDFFCPMCRMSLTATDIHENIVHLVMIDELSEKHDVYFSRIEGEFCTYKISEHKIETFGNASENYEKYFMTRHI
ncbi:hypothetical protein CYCD_10650 [Tenuifilaceae bacterium CYCD]|nr:hypothetical protein CYCD_10650 [Tenuifilaceae bacterium CYCD]